MLFCGGVLIHFQSLMRLPSIAIAFFTILHVIQDSKDPKKRIWVKDHEYHLIWNEFSIFCFLFLFKMDIYYDLVDNGCCNGNRKMAYLLIHQQFGIWWLKLRKRSNWNLECFSQFACWFRAASWMIYNNLFKRIL